MLEGKEARGQGDLEEGASGSPRAGRDGVG